MKIDGKKEGRKEEAVEYRQGEMEEWREEGYVGNREMERQGGRKEKGERENLENE